MIGYFQSGIMPGLALKLCAYCPAEENDKKPDKSTEFLSPALVHKTHSHPVPSFASVTQAFFGSDSFENLLKATVPL